MVSTISSIGLQTKPKALIKAMSDFAGGALSLKEIRQIISNEIQNNPDCGGMVHEMLDEELQAMRLSVADHNELMAGIDAALSENIPTETAEDAPSAPGIYRLDDEGTLILSDDKQKFQTPTEAYDSVGTPAKSKAKDKPQKTQQQVKRAEIKSGSILRERFRLDKEVARGSMGVVYKAVDLLKQEAGAADPVVAVKLISPEFASHRSALKTFQNEIANTQHLSHPNIIHLFELDKDGDNYFITMEWLEGESLDALLDRSQGSALPPVQTYAIIEQLCDALAYAHERDVIHADVKPGNVFLVKTGELKLIDFGIARVDAPKNDKSNQDELGTALTPAYASCERLEMAEPTVQDDLYALACMIYRLLSGRRVFGAMHALEAEKAAIEPVRIGGMSDDRWNALRQALSFRRAYRQTSVNEFANKFGQRRIPRVIAPDEPDHTETTTLESLPAGALDHDTSKLDTQNETSKLKNLAGSDDAPDNDSPRVLESSSDEFFDAESDELDIDLLNLDELPDSVDTFNLGGGSGGIDTTRMEALNETAELQALAGPSNDTTRMEALNETSELQELAVSDELQNDIQAPVASENSVDADKNIMHVDTARLNAQPDFELFAMASQDEASKEEEVAFVDTVNLNEAPEIINIFDGDGTGFLPEKDPAASVSVPVDEPPPPAKVRPAPEARKEARKKTGKPKGKATKKAAKQTAKKAKAVPDEKITPLHTEKVTRQLSGGSQRQIVKRSGFSPLVFVREKPQLAAGSLLGIIAVMIGAGFMMSFDKPEPIVLNTGTLQLSVPVQKVLPGQANEAAPDALANMDNGEAVMVDLTAPVEQASVASDTYIAAVVVDLSASAEKPAGANVGPGVVPVEQTQPVGMAQSPSPSDMNSHSVGQVADTPIEKPANPVSSPVAAVVPAVTATPATPDVSVKMPSKVSANSDFAPAVNVPVQTAPHLPKIPAPVEEKVIAEEVTIAVTNKATNKGTWTAVTKTSLELHANARKALAEGRLVQPDNDNAAYWLEQMKDEGGNVPALIAIESKLANALIQRAEDTYIAGDLDAAQGWIDLAQRNGAKEDELTPLRSAITKMKRDEAAAIAVGRAPTTQSSGAAATGQTGIDPYQTVALSSFEFARYVEPEYPSGFVGRKVSGWVDVSFTVGKDGKPRSIQVIGADLPDRFEAPSIAAVKRWRFEPYAPDGQPIVANTAVRLRYSQ